MSIYDIIADKRYVTLNLADIGLPEVPVVGVYVQPCASDKLDIHLHPGIFEAVYMVRGQQFFEVGGKAYGLKSNDVFITAPDIFHGSGSHIMEKAFFYWLQLKMPDKGRSILCLDALNSEKLCEAIRNIRINKFAGEREIEEYFEDIFRLFHTDTPLRQISIANKLINILLSLTRCAALPNKSSLTSDIQAVVALIGESREKFLTVDEMAEKTGLSTSRFKCKFKKQTGLPPAEYQLRDKIAFAADMLENTSKSITEIAYKCGFSSSQYFATVYKKFTRRTPTESRKLHNKR